MVANLQKSMNSDNLILTIKRPELDHIYVMTPTNERDLKRILYAGYDPSEMIEISDPDTGEVISTISLDALF